MKNKEVVDCNLKRRNNYSTCFTLVHYFNQFWAIGGKDYKDNRYGRPETVNKIRTYDPDSKTASLSPVKMIQARHDHRAIVYKDKFFVFGGEYKTNVLNSVEMYSPETN